MSSQSFTSDYTNLTYPHTPPDNNLDNEFSDSESDNEFSDNENNTSFVNYDFDERCKLLLSDSESENENDENNCNYSKHKLLLRIRQLLNNDNFEGLEKIGKINNKLTNSLQNDQDSSTEKYEGFYGIETINNLCPIPLPTNKPVSDNFLKLFDMVLCDLVRKKSYIEYNNSVKCVLSGIPILINKIFYFKYNGYTYYFHEGLTHYYKNFNVQPSREFCTALRANLFKTPV